MKKRMKTFGVILILSAAAVRFCIAGDAPNFLFIISDDQSFRAIGSNGNDVIQTPNLDSLAADGMLFTHCLNMGSYSGAICLASRAMLNTGRYVWQAEAAVGTNTLWAEYFENAGYDTFMSGKWHVSGGGLDEANSSAKAFESAKAVGKGFYLSTDQYDRPAANPQWAPDDITLLGHWSPEVWDVTNHLSETPYTVEKHTSELYADNAIEFLNSRTGASNPFFMYVSFNAPHDPRQAPTEYQEMYNPFNPVIPPNLLGEYPYELAPQRDDATTSYPITEESYKLHLKEYYAMISHMDAQVGRILSALQASGKADNTYVIFTSDQGLAIGEHGYMGKQILYDHSVRVPFFIKGPNVPVHSQVDAMFYMQSIVPTTLELAGITVPSGIDFPSLTGLMNGSTNKLYDSLYGGLFASNMPQRMVRTDKYKLILYPYIDTCLLYDLEADPWEATNLLAQTTYGQIANDLYEKFQAWHDELEDPYTMPFVDFNSVHVDDARMDKIVYSGSWNHIARSVSIEETISLNNQTGAAAELTFDGVDVRLYTQKGAGAGIFDIYLDDVLVDTYDCYAPSQVDQVKAFERRNLSPGTHTIRIVNTGTKNPAGTGYNVHLDMITYNRTVVRPSGLVDRTDGSGGTVTSQHSDSPAGSGPEQLFDNDPDTKYVTSNSTSWVQYRFGNGNKYAVRWYSLTSAQEDPGPPPVNLVSNGSFESGISPWTLSNTTITDASATNGSYSLMFDKFIPSTSAKQNVTVELGKTYKLSVWINSLGLTGGNVVFDTLDNYDNTCQFVINSSNGGWKEYTGTFTATNTICPVRMFTIKTDFSGVAYFDNISLTEVQSTSSGTSDKDPASWTLSGSDDGSNWTVIDSRSGVEFSSRGQALEFDTDLLYLDWYTTWAGGGGGYGYEYYRLDATNNGGAVMSLAELELFGYSWESGAPVWAPVTGTPADDDDDDGRDNLYEYVLNGDPTDPSNVGVDPIFTKTTNGFQYVHVQRKDDPDLIYSVESTTNLISGPWVPAVVTTTTNASGGAFNEVTHAIQPGQPYSYLRLKVRKP